ncbi:hypothetical protein GCM10009574_059940 [Streptomyces asiaticus]|uniref:Uncharacterized protein n=2 Tax=Streptomyces rhizosphaericus TaxID=114699 RepID=A0ABN1SJ41_9ACTN
MGAQSAVRRGWVSSLHYWGQTVDKPPVGAAETATKPVRMRHGIVRGAPNRTEAGTVEGEPTHFPERWPRVYCGTAAREEKAHDVRQARLRQLREPRQ